MRVIRSRAPVRICDNGGWTDTWFSRHGAVFHIAVAPYVSVTLTVGLSGRPEVVAPVTPLVEAALSAARLPLTRVVVDVACDVPPGSGTGTSAAVAVALLGALAVLDGQPAEPATIAAAAHRLEVETLGQESGIQDQLASAYGGINYVEMPEYPAAVVTALHPPEPTVRELDARLILLYLGRPHESSAVHAQVIRGLVGEGAASPRLERLRAVAARSRDAVVRGDLDELGRAMIANCDAQAALHPALVSGDARRVIDVARRSGAAGWKVNGAGGEGGSMTLLAGPDTRDEVVDAILGVDPTFKVIPIQVGAEGLRVWEL